MNNWWFIMATLTLLSFAGAYFLVKTDRDKQPEVTDNFNSSEELHGILLAQLYDVNMLSDYLAVINETPQNGTVQDSFGCGICTENIYYNIKENRWVLGYD